MPRLGDLLSPQHRRLLILSQFVPGRIIHLEVTFPQKAKPKFLVIALPAPECWAFVINSEVHRFIKARPDLNVCQVTIDAARHTCLQYDSVIACHEALSFDREEVIAELVGDPSRVKDLVCAEVREQMVAAVKRAITFDLEKQQAIVSALSAAK